MCLVAHGYGLHRTTQDNGSEIGRFKCVMSFCNTFVTFCICIITRLAQKIKTYFSKNAYFVYSDYKNYGKGSQKYI